jgi:hypothetical protein
MAEDPTPQQLAQQLARAEVPVCIARLKTLSSGQGGRGAGDSLRATLALLELAGVTTSAAPASTSSLSRSADPSPLTGDSGGPGGRPKLMLVDKDGVQRFYDAQKQAGGEK